MLRDRNAQGNASVSCRDGPAHRTNSEVHRSVKGAGQGDEARAGDASGSQELVALSEEVLRVMLARRKFISWALSVSAHSRAPLSWSRSY